MIQLKNISLAYGEHRIFHNLNLDIAEVNLLQSSGKAAVGKLHCLILLLF